MSPIHEQLYEALLPVCIEASNRARPSPTPVEEHPDEIKGKELVTWIKSREDSINSDYTLFVVKSFAILLPNSPSLRNYRRGRNAGKSYDPFVVINNGLQVSGQHQIVLVIHSANNSSNIFVLSEDGEHYEMTLKKNHTIATEPEIDAFLRNLTTAQVRYILKGESPFTPIVESILDLEIVEEEAVSVEAAI